MHAHQSSWLRSMKVDHQQSMPGSDRERHIARVAADLISSGWLKRKLKAMEESPADFPESKVQKYLRKSVKRR